MTLTFQTENDIITFGLSSRYVCSEVSGINEGTVNRRKINYIDTDGADFVDDLYEEREITINGYIHAKSKIELENLQSEFCRICNGKNRGKFIYESANKRYFTEAIAEIPEFGERIGKVKLFSIKIIAYRFYWKSYLETKAVIVSFENHIKSEFQFPLIFTSKKSKAIIPNSGTIPAEPTFEIRCTESGKNNGVLTILNHTTGKMIELDYNMTSGERLIIDTSSCNIESNQNGNLLKYMKPSSEFFKLQQGANELEVTNTDSSCMYSCICSHYNTYVGV